MIDSNALDNLELLSLEGDTLTEFVLKGRDMSVVKSRAELFSGFVENHLSKLVKSRDKILLVDLQKICRSISSEIYITWAKMDDLVDDSTDVEGVIFTIKGESRPSYLIYLNQNIRLIADPNDKCNCPDINPVDDCATKCYWQTLRQVYLHEVSHLLLRHGEDGLLVSPTNEALSATPALFETCNLAARLYRKVRVEQDFDCEIFSLALAFWPSEKFTRSVMLLLKHWNECGSIRTQLSNAFRMPINATVQWLSIMFGEKLGVHYIRRNEETEEWLDWLDVNKNLNLFATYQPSGNNIFLCEDTAAYKAAKEYCDRKTLRTDNPCFCEALYNKKQSLYNMRFDEIVVVGFLTQKVQEELNVFSAGGIQ